VTPSADRPSDASGRQYHIGLAPGEVAPWIVLVGDPARAERVAERMDVRVRRAHREYLSFTGALGGREVTVMGTGIGCDNVEIAVAELLACERRPTFVRIGSSGGLRAEMELGDLVISTGAVRLENTSLGFVEEGFPAIAHHEVVLAMVSAAEALGARYHVGLTATASGFYGWQGRQGGLFEPRFPDLAERLARQGVLNLEMESSTLFTLAQLAGVRAGTVCAVYANRPKNRFVDGEAKERAEAGAIELGLRTLDFLAQMDERARGKRYHLDG
jgi:uridine phosphorylase